MLDLVDDGRNSSGSPIGIIQIRASLFLFLSRKRGFSTTSIAYRMIVLRGTMLCSKLTIMKRNRVRISLLIAELGIIMHSF